MANQVQTQSFTAAAVLTCALAGVAQPASSNGSHNMIMNSVGEAALFFDQEIVKDSPFTANATTRSVQQLADGNRIINEDSTRILRDSAGRVRRESGTADGPREVTISDPANKHSWVLNTQQKTAFKMQQGFDFIDLRDLNPGEIEMPDMAVVAEELSNLDLPDGFDINDLDIDEASINASIQAGLQAAGEVQHLIGQEIAGALASLPTDVVMIDAINMNGTAAPSINAFPAFAAATMSGGQGVTETKPLGQKRLSGVRVEGTELTTTIAAGAIGNEAPIVIKKTTWYAPELRLMISSEESDPRFGTLSYRVDIESQNEPAAHLFELPQGYRVIGDETP